MHIPPAMRTELHIIASCTDRKRAPVPLELHLRALREREPERRARRWWRNLWEHPHPTQPACDLYAGDHWRVVKELPALATEARFHPRLWVASAGYGLIPADAPVRPYSATFARGHADSVVPKADSRPTRELLRQWWRSLAREPGPAPGEPRLVQELARAAPRARFLVVASPAYIAALEEDLALAARALRHPEHLLVISTPAAASRGVLAPQWVPSSARLQSKYGGALSSLNARVARDLLVRARKKGEGSVMDAPSVQGYYGRLIHRSAPQKRFERTHMTDDEVMQFIARESRMERFSWSATLRRLRDSGRACEQQRFRRLFHQYQERVA
ncbi:hypothetical protein NR798_05775 [Archangium gephyra]|uniref:hypothetical protein n=1 Tax=Archangium gephyra TaxID=48 RepID=UPI0035D50669